MPHLLPLPGGWPEGDLLATAASLRLGHFLTHRLLLRSPLQDLWSRRTLKLKRQYYLAWSSDALSATCSAFFTNDNQSGQEAKIRRSSHSDASKGSPYQRRWTNVLLAANVLVYVAQIATQGKVMLWGAKINSLINQGQLWRLVTSSFLHANVGHLLINCYSLNSVGPSVETISGPRRFFGIYFTSAVASTAMSYWLCKAPAVGASGAIFGLVGSVAVFVMRHRGEGGRGTEDLQQIARVIVLNMVIGLMSRGIDNWGHEVVHSMRRKRGKKGWMIMKFNLEKAYDRLRWNFVLDSLVDAGFSEKWRSWVNSCISTTALALCGMGRQQTSFVHREESGKVTRFLLTFSSFVWKNFVI